MVFKRRKETFTLRKSKTYKNLISFGQFGVLTGIALSALSTLSVVSAEETTQPTNTLSSTPPPRL